MDIYEEEALKEQLLKYARETAERYKKPWDISIDGQGFWILNRDWTVSETELKHAVEFIKSKQIALSQKDKMWYLDSGYRMFRQFDSVEELLEKFSYKIKEYYDPHKKRVCRTQLRTDRCKGNFLNLTDEDGRYIGNVTEVLNVDLRQYLKMLE